MSECGEYSGILLVPHHIVMDLNNVMQYVSFVIYLELQNL